MVEFGYTIIYVENVKETISFFENAFGMQKKFVTGVVEKAPL